MAVDEEARRGLEDRLETVLGREHATTLMRYLPWEELATKQDLKALEPRFDGIDKRFDGIDKRFDAVYVRFDRLEERVTGLEHHMIGFGHRMDGYELRLVEMERRTELRIDSSRDRVLAALHEGIGGLRMDLINQTRLLFFAMIATLMTLAGLAFGAALLRGPI
ncbi:MAG TPA: hypothetical protein VFF07_15510 [Actinomycetota bacterium]|nr:hypothetical protein [Actinomycetota bacterium]